MTNPVDGIEDNKLNRCIRKNMEFKKFLRGYKKEEFCQHLSVVEKSRSPFERAGITCKFMSSATCRTELLSPKDAIHNCHKCSSTCPNFKAVEIEEKPLSLKDIEDTFYKDFDIEETCDLEEQLKPKCYDRSTCDKCQWHHKPQITDSALLQFICLLHKEHIEISGSSIEALKSDVLQSLSAHKPLFYDEVRKILS